MSATIFNIKNFNNPTYVPPELLFIDTSFIIQTFVPIPEACSGGGPSSTNVLCRDYFDALKAYAQKQEIYLFTSDNVINELFYFILKKAIEFREFPIAPFDAHKIQYDNKKNNAVGKVFKDHPELIKKYHVLLSHFYSLITSVPILILDHSLLSDSTVPSISEIASDLINNYQILPADAFNLAVANKAGIKDILAIDVDYHRVSSINVHTYLVSSPQRCSVCSAPIA